MQLVNKIFSIFFGTKVGKDQFGNTFYESIKLSRHFNRNMRWVVYKGIPEATKIQVDWYCWLNYQSKQLPTESRLKTYICSKSRKINLTESNKQPSLSIGVSKSHKIYTSWKPK